MPRSTVRRLALGALFLFVVLLAALGAPCTGKAAERGPAFIQEGIASWYGPGFHGRRTANGEVFSMHLMTAASVVLPMNTIVRVTLLDTRASVRVRINDRGPFIAGRIIDLSRRAAGVLGMEKRGIARVRVSVWMEDQTSPQVRRWLRGLEKRRER